MENGIPLLIFYLVWNAAAALQCAHTVYMQKNLI